MTTGKGLFMKAKKKQFLRHALFYLLVLSMLTGMISTVGFLEIPVVEANAATHTHTDACKEAPTHTHQRIVDETWYEYTCDCTATNSYKYVSTYSKDESDCNHKGEEVHIKYYCKRCGELMYEEKHDGCNYSTCDNYKKGNADYDYETHPGTHTYKKQGKRYECKNTTTFNDGDNYKEDGEWDVDYNVICNQCGVVLYHMEDEHEYDNDYGGTDELTITASAARHYYYVPETTDASCYTLDHSGIHYPSGFTEEKEEEHDDRENCGKVHEDYTTTYYCAACHYLYKTKKYTDSCSICDIDSETEWLAPGYPRTFYENHYLIGSPDYTYQESYLDKNWYKINNTALHTTITMTCTQSDAYGPIICDKVVTSLTPLAPNQTVGYGNPINTQATAAFLDGHTEVVNCEISYDSTLLNQTQTAKLSYGEYTSVSEKGPRSVNITLKIELLDAGVMVAVSPSEAGTAIGTGNYTIGSEVSVSVTGNPGYVFQGWYDGTTLKSTDMNYTFTMPGAAVSLIAQFTTNTYALNVFSEFPSMGSVTAPASAAYQSDVTVTATPNTGYTFAGWYDGVALVSTDATYTFSMPAHVYSLMARFSAASQTVSFDSKGGTSCSSIQVEYLGTYGKLPIPTKTGYVFQGWTYNGVYITETTPVTVQSNHTLTAVWEIAGPEFILVDFGDPYGKNSWSTDSANIGQLGLSASTLNLWLPQPLKQGYGFVGWYKTEDGKGNGASLGDNNNLVTKTTVLRAVERHTIHAGWQENSYILSFDANGGSSCSNMTITYDRRYGYHKELPTPTKTGYTFAGWYASELDNNGVGTQIENDTRVQAVANQTLYAKWTQDPISITVNFEARTKGQIGLTPEESAMLGFGSTIGQITSGSATANLLYPGTYGGHPITWCQKEDTETHSTANGWKTYGNKHYYLNVTGAGSYLFPMVSRTGYTFAYWELSNSTKITQTTNIALAQNHTVYAHYIPNTYTVTLDSQGATSTNHTKTVTVTFDAPCPDIIVPTKPGYIFDGYYTEKEGSGTQYYDKDGQSTKIWTETEDTTLYAKWMPNEYIVTFDWNFDYNATTQGNQTNWIGNTKKVMLHETYGTLPKPERLGYTFIGWYETESNNNGTGMQVTETTILKREENHTLYAKWKVNEYTITFDWNFNYNATGQQTKTNWTGNTKTVTFDAAYGTLPTPERLGYTFIGWYETESNNNGTGTQVTETTILQRAENHTLYAKWEVNTYTVILDQRGALIPGQTSFEIEFDAPLTDLTGAMPQKRGYTFHGYCSDKHGNGTPYFDETGTAILYAPTANPSNRFNAQNFVTILYAYWTQDEVEKPEAGDRDEPNEDDWTTNEDDAIEEEVTRVPASILIYADDYNAATGANTDKQPYLVQDSIPSTEQVAIRGKMDAWLLSYKVLRHAGIEYVPYTVTVTYRTQHEIEEEELVVSRVKTRTKTYMIPKTWAYYALENFGLYKPEEVTVTNDAFESSVTISVAGDAQTPYPSVERTVYGSKDGHILWPSSSFSKNVEHVGTVSYTTGTNANGPYVSVVLPEQYLISDVVGSLPNTESILDILSGNVAWEDTTTYTAWSDKLTWDGMVVLDDTKLPVSGAEYNDAILPKTEDTAPDTWYRQVYRSGILLKETTANGSYASYASIRYKGDVNNVAVVAEIILYSESSNAISVNPIVIHTPVVCDGIIDTKLSGAMCAATDTAELTLNEDLNFFRLQVSNYGTHKLMLGYGEKDFLYALSGKSNLARDNGTVYNQVQFPFGVFVDVGADSYREDGGYDTTGDYYIEAGTWLTVGEDEIVFYVPVTLQEDTYTVNFRSISVNCPIGEMGQFSIQRGQGGNSQYRANISLSSYVAYDTIELTIRGCMNQFEITGTSDEEAQKQLEAGSQLLTLKKGNWFNYRFVSQGSFFGDAAHVTIIPTYYWIPEHGQTRVETDLYYTETINGTLAHYVQMGSEKDAANIHTVTNRDTSLAIAKKLLDNTARVLSDNTFVGQVGESYTFTKLELNRYMRMLGVLDTTHLPTKYCPVCHVAYRENEMAVCTHTLVSTGIKERAELTKQEWYGQLYLPAYCYVIPKGTKSGYCSHCNKTCYVTGSITECEQCHSNLENLQTFDFALYSSMQTLTGKETFFQTKGTILLAFEIIATNDRGEEVRYTAWAETELAKQWKNSNIPYKEGDVIRYHVGKKFGDDYEVGGVE